MISNVNINVVPVHGGLSAAVCWHAKGFRYHFWTDLADVDLTPQKNILYKNAIKYDSKVNTMRLRADAVANAAMIKLVMEHIAKTNMVDAARAEHRAKEDAEKRKREEDMRAAVERELAIEFFAKFEAAARHAFAHGFSSYGELLAELYARRATLLKERGF